MQKKQLNFTEAYISQINIINEAVKQVAELIFAIVYKYDRGDKKLFNEDGRLIKRAANEINDAVQSITWPNKVSANIISGEFGYPEISLSIATNPEILPPDIRHQHYIVKKYLIVSSDRRTGLYTYYTSNINKLKTNLNHKELNTSVELYNQKIDQLRALENELLDTAATFLYI
jgi:hypothetical protein